MDIASNNLSLLLRSLELNFEKGVRPFVVFPNSVIKGYLYDALARVGRPHAFEPFYLDELLTLTSVGKKRMSREHKQWRLEHLLEEEGSFDKLSPGVRRKQIELHASRLARRFTEFEESNIGELDPCEQRLWQALFSDERYAPLSQIKAKIPKGVALHAFGFSFLPASWKEILKSLNASLYLLTPSSHYLGGGGLLGKWSALCRHMLDDLDLTPLIVIPQSVTKHPVYAPLILPEMGLETQSSCDRLAFLKADIALGREEAIELPKDTSVMAYVTGDEAAHCADLVRAALERGLLAKEIAVYAPNLQEFAAAFRREKIPFTLLGSKLSQDEARLVALRLPLGPCERADLEQLAFLLFPKGESLSWLKRLRGGKEAFFLELKRWSEEVLESGALISAESLGEELAALLSLVEKAFSLSELENRPLAEWIELFDVDIEQTYAFDVDMPVSYSSAVAYLDEIFIQARGAPNFNQDLVRLSPLDHRFILPVKCAVIAGLGEEGGDLERASLALLHLIGQTSEQIAFTCKEMPGPLLDDLLVSFPIELEKVSKIPKSEGAEKFEFFTTWKEPVLSSVEVFPCRLSDARRALVDPIGWFMQKPREESAAGRLMPTPLEKAIAVRSSALGGPLELELNGPFARAAREVMELEAAEKSSLLSALGDKKRLIFSRNIARLITQGEDNFYPATWIEGAIDNYCEKGLIVFGKDEAKLRARHLPDLALLDSVGEPPRLFFVDLEKSVDFLGPFSLKAIAHFVALAKAQPAPLFPQAIDALLSGDVDAFSKALAFEDAEQLLALWQPVAKELYGAL